MDDDAHRVTRSFEPAPPPLFDGFRSRRTAGQRKRAAIRRADITRQQVLLFGARVKQRVLR
jgi:ABC-type arginine transport system ATPase subunit